MNRPLVLAVLLALGGRGTEPRAEPAPAAALPAQAEAAHTWVAG